MRVRITLFPTITRIPLPLNYNYFLTSLIYSFIESSSKDYSKFLHHKGYRLGGSKKGFKLFTYSMLIGEAISIKSDKIIFEKGPIHWFLSSPMRDFIQHLITGIFFEGNEIKIGPTDKEVPFIIEQVETLPRLEFKETMRFTCLSPITVSKVNSLSGLNGLKCHYLRPWEEGFSEAIRDNLIKKYKLVYEKDIHSPDFKIAIDTEYMSKRSGKITKKINFKGTDIIGFIAPFEVRGNPELIEIGYEAGFGEKGSMGFGMVKEVV